MVFQEFVAKCTCQEHSYEILHRAPANSTENVSVVVFHLQGLVGGGGERHRSAGGEARAGE